MSPKTFKILRVKLDWSRLLGFDQVKAAQATANSRQSRTLIGAKIGTKVGTKSGGGGDSGVTVILYR